MLGGYTGKLLRVNLTNRSVSVMDSGKYQEYGGGFGMGAAIFWDLAVAPGAWDMQDSFDPRNVISIMGNPFSGTFTPAAGGKCNVQSLGPQGYPTEWFTRSNIGGRLCGMMKLAGWDGLIFEGKADHPVWVNIIDDQVTIEDATELWGKDTYVTQQKIWRMVTGWKIDGWHETARGATTQKPAVLCIGPAGEHLTRNATLQHDSADACGQGGFGAVFGSKNLKAVSILGTSAGVKIADPKAFMEARLWYRDKFQYNVDDPKSEMPLPASELPKLASKPNPNLGNMSIPGSIWGLNAHHPGVLTLGNVIEPSRPTGCQACPAPCRSRTESGYGNDSACGPLALAPVWGAMFQEAGEVADTIQRLGINAYEFGYFHGLYVFTLLMQMGVVGPGKQIDTGNLPIDQHGKIDLPLAVARAIAYRQPGFGEIAAEGMARAAKKWGRYDEDTSTGLLPLAYWGWWYHYEPRVDTDYAYGSILGDREINEFSFLIPMHWLTASAKVFWQEPFVTAEEAVTIISRKTGPAKYLNDPMMFNYNDAYSEHVVKRVAWQRHYASFWSHSLSLCTIQWPSWYNMNSPDKLGATPDGELKFYNAITGKNITIEDSDEIGRKIWNLLRAIWIMQGRHRDMEYFTNYVYDVPTTQPFYKTVYEDGKWIWSDNLGKKLDRARFEEFKTRYYEFEGWDTKSGWPKRGTLEDLGLKNVADVLEAKGKLGE